MRQTYVESSYDHGQGKFTIGDTARGPCNHSQNMDMSTNLDRFEALRERVLSTYHTPVLQSHSKQACGSNDVPTSKICSTPFPSVNLKTS